MHNLLPSGRVRFYGRHCFARVNRGNGRSAGTGSGRLRLSSSSFENSEFKLVGPEHAHEFDVCALREFGALADSRRTLLPLRGKSLHELHEVWVAGRDHKSSGLALRMDVSP